MASTGEGHGEEKSGCALLVDTVSPNNLCSDEWSEAMVEEERFNRFKHSPRVSADMSIEFCLKRAGVTLDDVD